jgi:hypothetical protein
MPQAAGNIFNGRGCTYGHGVELDVGAGSVPDLRRINAATYALFSQIVRGGLFKDAGMPVFADAIREDELPALKATLSMRLGRTIGRNQCRALEPRQR